MWAGSRIVGNSGPLFDGQLMTVEIDGHADLSGDLAWRFGYTAMQNRTQVLYISIRPSLHPVRGTVMYIAANHASLRRGAGVKGGGEGGDLFQAS
jgi:hypothetical protein